MKSITNALAEMHDDTMGAEVEGSIYKYSINNGRSNRKQSKKKISKEPSLGVQRTAMWPHVAGSAVGAEAGLTAFQAAPDVPTTGGSGGGGGGGRGGAPPDFRSKRKGRSSTSSSSKASDGGGFFLYRDGLPAQAFAPAPLPAPLPPMKRCDVFQRRLPRAPDAPPEDKV